jgi:hypothetical protein
MVVTVPGSMPPFACIIELPMADRQAPRNWDRNAVIPQLTRYGRAAIQCVVVRRDAMSGLGRGIRQHGASHLHCRRQDRLEAVRADYWDELHVPGAIIADPLAVKLSARVVAFKDRQQVTEVGFRSEFADQADISFDPVVFADHRFVRQGQSLVHVDRIERIGDYASDIASGPVVLICHPRTISDGDVKITHSDRRRGHRAAHYSRSDSGHQGVSPAWRGSCRIRCGCHVQALVARNLRRPRASRSWGMAARRRMLGRKDWVSEEPHRD